MKRVSLCRVLAVVACLVVAAPTGAVEDNPGQSLSARVAEAEALLRDGRIDEALVLLRPITEAHARHPEALFLRGLGATQMATQPGRTEADRVALLDEAIAAFRTMLIDRPDLVRVRLELARAFFYQRKDSLARQHFEQVLAGDLPPPVIANVQRFLAEIRARKRWSVYIGAALAPDSNIGAASDERFIEINIGGVPLPFRRDQEELTTSGVGLSLWTGGEYQHPLGDRVRLRAGGDLSRREYAGGDFDQTHLGVHLGPRWLAGPRTDLSFLGNARRSLVAGSGDYDALGGRFEARRWLTPRVSVTGRASWHDRRYREDRHLDGPARDLSLSASWVATPTVRLDGALGYGTERPELVRNRNTSRGCGWESGRPFRRGSPSARARSFAGRTTRASGLPTPRRGSYAKIGPDP